MPLWEFSESSQGLLNRFKEASKREETNKWIEKFGYLNNVNISKKDGDKVILPQEESDSESVSSQATVVIEKVDVCEDVWREVIDQDPIVHFDYIVENCLKNSALYTILATNLPISSVEKFFHHLIELKDVNSIFLENFYTKFLPTFFKRENTRLPFDMLIKAEKSNNVLFKMLSDIVIKDIEFPNQVLQQYVSTLDKNKQIEVLKNIIVIDISSEVFIHHLYTIHILYKNCEMTEDVQKYILTKFSEISHLCLANKNFGRFLLTFLQNQKKFDTDFDLIQRIIDSHKSPFKKPCINAFNELKKSKDMMETD